jgi:hypothetical protein
MILIPLGVVQQLPAGDAESQLPPFEVDAVTEKLMAVPVLAIAKTCGNGSGAPNKRVKYSGFTGSKALAPNPALGKHANNSSPNIAPRNPLYNPV